jgi:hypothetical protein
MSEFNKQKLTLPPLKCEQLEDRQVLTVHVGPTAALPTEAVHPHIAPVAATNIMVAPTPMQLPISGVVQQNSQQGGSAEAGSSAAAAASSVSSAASSSAPSATSAAGSASGGASGGGPLFTSGSLPLLAFAASSPQLPGAPIPTSILETVTSSTASSSGSVQVNLPDPINPAPATPAPSEVNDVAQLAIQNTPPADGTTLSLYLAPTPVQTPGPNSIDSAVATTDNKPLTMPTTTLSTLTTTTTSTTTTPKENIPFVVHSSLDAPTDDQDITPDATVQNQ